MAILAQVANGFSYEPADLSSLPKFLDNITQKKIFQYQGNYKKETAEYWQEKRLDILENIKDSLYIFDERIDRGLKKILANIYAANPEIDSVDFRFFINTSPVPNASCHGNGIYVINNGLFSIIESDDELAFILCHEIAHHLLRHNDISVEEYFKKMGSKSLKQSVRKISRKRHGKFSAAQGLLNDIQLKLTRKSRKAELEADSLGLKLFLKTSYNKEAISGIMGKLDFDEKAVLNSNINLKAHFDTKNYPFRSSWVKKSDPIIFNITESANDYSLKKELTKTHPNIPERINILSLKMESIENNTTTISTKTAEILKKRSENHRFKIAIDNLYLDVALYFTISLYQEEKITKQELNLQLVLVLKLLYLMKKNHILGKFVPPTSPFSQEKQINKVRHFIHNIEPKNIRKLGYWICKENETSFTNEEDKDNLYTFFQNLNSTK
ncbi:MAG: M48 family metalloprotease [Flavobacteriaceae bacterium]|nr:M48 family metalloprotease [Flavobacteriaceae bacterium]